MICGPILAIWAILNGDLGRTMNFPRMFETWFQLSCWLHALLAFFLNYTIFFKTIMNSCLSQTMCGNLKDVLMWYQGYVEHGFSEATLSLFEKMQRLVCCLKACGSIRATLAGNEIHKDIEQKVFEIYFFIGITLVDMQAKYGSLAEAHVVFNKFSVQEHVSWNTLLQDMVRMGNLRKCSINFIK